MVRVLSLVALAAAAVVGAVTPAAAVPAIAIQRAATPAAPPAVAAAFTSSVAAVAALQRVASVHAEMVEELDLKALALRALEPVWEAYKAGKFDATIAAFKAGELDDHIPTEKEVLATLEHIMEVIEETVPVVYKLLDEVKAGKHDELLADAKEGTLEEFMKRIAAELLATSF